MLCAAVPTPATAPWSTRGEVKVRLDVAPAYLERIAERIARVYLGPEHRPSELLGVARRGRAEYSPARL